MTRTGYTFGGWYQNSSFSGSAVTSIGASETGNKTYYAKWTGKTYTVTLNTNGGTINSGNVTQYTYGKGATLPGTGQISKEGYVFEGWYDNGAFTGNPVTAISSTATGNKAFYAKWTAAAPESKPTVKVTGKVTSFGSGSDHVTIQLITQGESEASHEVTADGTGTGYTIDGVEPGSYIMKVLKKNHVTREYTINVTDGDVTQDVRINLYGDINGDGNVTSTDNVKLLRHIKNSVPLTGYELICADANGDGKVTSSDSVKMLRHIKGILALFS